MKLRTVLLVLLVYVFISAIPGLAVERKKIAAIDTDKLTTDTQVSASCGDDHLNLAWWIPNEFWEATFANDHSTSDADKKQILNTMRPYSILAICQADISNFGAFNFYSKYEIENRLVLKVETPSGRVREIAPLKDIDPDLQIMLNAFKPILSAAMGNLGENLHFYVLQDTNDSGERLIDPYANGALHIQLRERDGTRLDTAIETPLNSLFVPRKCPNGKEAHVTWKFCPWTGQKLSD